MDDPHLPDSEHAAALGALARINVLSRTAGQLAGAVISRLAATGRAPHTRPVVVDVACGGGDVTVGLAARLGRMTARRGWAPPEVIGIDMSEFAVDRARKLAAARGVDVRFSTADVTQTGCPTCDVAVSSLFLHHLDDATSIRLLRSLAAAASHGVVISDLVRSRLGLALAVAGTSLLSTSRVARVDGPRSVRAARTPTEYRALCRAAGVDGATVRRTWPERVLIEWPGQNQPRGARAS